MNSITCIDCGVELTGNMSTGKLVKKYGWVHVAKGKFRCKNCNKFISESLKKEEQVYGN